jgi:hypothetical protein
MLKLFLLFVFSATSGFAQPQLKQLSLEVKPDFKTQTIEVIAQQSWSQLSGIDTLVLDFFPDYQIASLKVDGIKSDFMYSKLDSSIRIFKGKSDKLELEIHYSGKPHQAKLPPWDGGFVWKKDTLGNDWLTTAVQGIGSKLWWPSPKNYATEPELSEITCIYPDNLFFKGNGRLKSDSMLLNGLRKTSWRTTYPINTYNICLNIGNYAHWSDTLILMDDSKLSLDFYPLRQNLDASKRQFQQAKPMLSCFNKTFDTYPFQKDGYGIVETPYAGMEHQSCIAYGNGYVDGYLGKDYSGIGLNFDFILIHESGHEWWGNSVSAKNEEDFWLQEAFCTYAEYVYVNCLYGNGKAEDYINAKKLLVKNEGPILGSDDSGADMYSKGALMLYTMSGFTKTPEEFIEIIGDFYKAYAYKSISSAEVFAYFSSRIENCNPAFFTQYLNLKQPPILKADILINQGNSVISCSIVNAVENFKMPLFLKNKNGEVRKILVGKESITQNLQGIDWTILENKGYFLLTK